MDIITKFIVTTTIKILKIFHKENSNITDESMAKIKKTIDVINELDRIMDSFDLMRKLAEKNESLSEKILDDKKLSNNKIEKLNELKTIIEELSDEINKFAGMDLLSEIIVWKFETDIAKKKFLHMIKMLHIFCEDLYARFESYASRNGWILTKIKQE
jgi:hypothetical protein